MKKIFLKRVVQITLVIVIIGVLGIGIILGNKEEKGILRINGVEILEEEYKMFLQDEKALTTNYFMHTYNAPYEENFWNTGYGDEIPLEYAKEKALETLVKVKIEDQLALEYGVVEDISYEAIQKEIRRDKSIYGVQNMDFFQAYNIYHSKILLKTIEQYKKLTPPIQQEKLEQEYEKMKEQFFDYPDELKILELKIGNIQEANKQVIDQIVNDLEEGIRLSDLKEKYGAQCDIEEAIVEYGKNESKEATGTELANLLKEKAYSLQDFQMTEPFIFLDQYYILVCLERKDGEVESFEVARIKIEEQLKEEAFEEVVKKRVEQAKVEINAQKYKEIQIN